MPKSIIARCLLVLFWFLAACKAHYAPIGYSSPMYVHKAKKQLTHEVKEMKNLKPQLENKDLAANTEIRAVKMVFPELNLKDAKVKIPIFLSKSGAERIQKQDPKQRLKEKRKKQRRKLWRKAGSNLTIGGVFLGIAIVLAILNLGSLATLFGLASIVFLYFGLKKFFKKRRKPIRNPFRKKP